MKPMIMLATVFVLFLFVLILSGVLWRESRIQAESGTLDYIEHSWQVSGPEGILKNCDEVGENLSVRAGKTYIMETQLTYDGSGDPMPCAFLQADHMFCRVTLDGQTLFSYLPENARKIDLSRSPGFICKAISLPADCRGKTMTVEFQPALPVLDSSPIPRVTFGDFRTVTRNRIHADLPFNIAAVLCMMLGISALLFSAASLTGSDYREGFNIGSFSLSAGIHLFSDKLQNQFLLYFQSLLCLLRQFPGGLPGTCGFYGCYAGMSSGNSEKNLYFCDHNSYAVLWH